MRKILTIIIFSLLMTSCMVYTPQQASIPLMTHKGETEIAAALQIDPLAQLQGNLDIAYAITDHVAAQVFGSIGGNSHALEGKVGYYLPMKYHMVAEGYLGGGYGSHRLYEDVDSLGQYHHTFNAANTPLFVQLNYGFADLTWANIDVAFGIKGGLLNYESSETRNNVTEQAQGTYGLIEPQFVLRLGPQNAKLQFQAGYCHIFVPAEDPALNYVPFSCSLGLNFQFDTRRKGRH